MSRLRDIWSLNVQLPASAGRLSKSAGRSSCRIPANHLRFLTDVGFRDDRASVMRTTGKGGLPAIRPWHSASGAVLSRPMDRAPSTTRRAAGRIRRVVERRRAPRLAQPVVCADGGHRASILRSSTFTLARNRRARLSTGSTSTTACQMTLERVELFSGLAIPSAE